MTAILAMATIITPIVSGVVEAIKRATGVNDNLLPIVAILVGVILGVLATFVVDVNTVDRVWAGGISGLAATGLFELGKNVKDEVRK